MKIGSKKIDNTLFWDKIKTVHFQTWLEFIVLIIGAITACFLILAGVWHLLIGETLVWNSVWTIIWSIFKSSFVEFIIPVYFISSTIKVMKKKWKLIEDCKIQLVEVTLLPKKILKS